MSGYRRAYQEAMRLYDAQKYQAATLALESAIGLMPNDKELPERKLAEFYLHSAKESPHERE